MLVLAVIVHMLKYAQMEPYVPLAFPPLRIKCCSARLPWC